MWLASKGLATRVFYIHGERVSHDYVVTQVQRDYREEVENYEAQRTCLSSPEGATMLIYPSENYPEDSFDVYAYDKTTKVFCCVVITKVVLIKWVGPQRPVVEVPSFQIVADSRWDTIRQGVRTWLERAHPELSLPDLIISWG